DALERVRGTFDDDFSDGGAAGEGDFVNAGMGHQRGSGGLAKTVDDVDDAGRKTKFFKPTGDFHHGERGLLGRLQDTGASGGDGGRELPGSHHQWIVPGNDLSGDAHRFAKSEAQGVRGNGINVAENFVGEAGIVFETG